MAARKKKDANREVPVDDYEHSGAHRTNNPPAGLAHLDRDKTPTKTLQYDPHLDPQMQWAGKVERSIAEIPAPSIHVHEELSAQKIVGSIRKQRLQQSLFDVSELDPAKAVEFYRHDMSWSNRMILGDSLVVMSSLLERERLAGQVQCIFMDPPYGIKYNSNFQPRISDTEVTDRRDDDLTREPEMIQAYRDTWELGIHSYLTYLRDRMTVSRELLTEEGSIFIQISAENVHRVRVLLDEVFGAQNFVAEIAYQKTTGAGSPNDELSSLPSVFDYIVWFAKDKSKMKYRQLYLEKELGGPGSSGYTQVEMEDGSVRPLSKDEAAGAALPSGARIFATQSLVAQSGSDKTRYPVTIGDREYRPNPGVWKTSEAGMERLIEAGRIRASSGSRLGYVRYWDDSSTYPLTNLWTDTVGQNQLGGEKRYVVQTALRAVARCLLMTTDPGDLVVDPTCGSGTTAVVAEQWGRRWITMDTSRVAMSIARERLLTNVYPFYELRDATRGVDGGFIYRSVERVMLQTIARGEPPVVTQLVDQPKVTKGLTRVSGPFTVEALSRYAINPSDKAPASGPSIEDASNHVETLLDALRRQGIPRPGAKPAKIESLTMLSGAGALQAEGVLERDGKLVKFAVSLGPRFGAITMAQVSDALQDAIGFGVVVFAGFAVASDAQAQLATGKVGGTDVALLLANPDLIAGDLLKNTSASQTFRLYASPDVGIEKEEDGWRATVVGVDSFDASTGDVTSFGRSGIQAWFLDDAYDGRVFRVSQAFFPATNGWEKLARALRGTVDAKLVDELHRWTSLPFETPESGKIAVRVIADDGNASEVILSVGSDGKITK
jgi:adenine-specific DNA-methyltransferase